MKHSIAIISLLFLIFNVGCANEAQNTEKVKMESFSKIIETNEKKETIGAAKTELLDKAKNRLHNIYKGMEKINGKILKPGEVFSFNDTLGKRNAASGYKVATILVGKRRSKAHGGGVCQISTTIYKAAIDAGLEIVEQHPHQKKMNYAKDGKDATVTYNIFDLKIKNNKEFDIKIEADSDGEILTVNILKL